MTPNQFAFAMAKHQVYLELAPVGDCQVEG